MTPDFDTPLERRGTDSVKWDEKPANRKGVPLLPMWVADMDFAAPTEVVRALMERASHPVYGYTLVNDRYPEAFRAWQRRRNGWDVPADWLVHTPGVMPAVRASILALTEPGDEVVLQPPVYYPFFSAVRDNGRSIVENPLVESPGGYRMDLEQLESVLTSRTRMLILCSPHNPVGRVWTADELRDLARVCERHELLILSDEIHGDLIRDGHRFVPVASLAPEIARRTVTFASPSKTFNIAGLSSSFTVIADRELQRRFRETAGRLGMELPNTLSLTAGAAAYSAGEPWLDALLSYLGGTFSWFQAEMSARFPRVRVSRIEGTYLAWLDLRAVMRESGATDAHVHSALLDRGALWLSDGARFGTGGAGFQRMNLACPRSVVADGLGRLGRALEALYIDPSGDEA